MTKRDLLFPTTNGVGNHLILYPKEHFLLFHQDEMLVGNTLRGKLPAYTMNPDPKAKAFQWLTLVSQATSEGIEELLNRYLKDPYPLIVRNQSSKINLNSEIDMHVSTVESSIAIDDNPDKIWLPADIPTRGDYYIPSHTSSFDARKYIKTLSENKLILQNVLDGTHPIYQLNPRVNTAYAIISSIRHGLSAGENEALTLSILNHKSLPLIERTPSTISTPKEHFIDPETEALIPSGGFIVDVQNLVKSLAGDVKMKSFKLTIELENGEFLNIKNAGNTK